MFLENIGMDFKYPFNDIDFQRLLKSGYFLLNPVIKPTKRKEKDLMVDIKSYISHREIYGYKYSTSDVKNFLSGISLIDAATFLSLFNTFLHNDDMTDLDKQLDFAQSIMDASSFRKLDDIIKTRGRDRVLFFEDQLLVCMVASILYCNESAPSLFEQRFEFTEFIFGVSDILEGLYDSEEEDDEHVWESFASFTIANLMFNHSQQYRYLIPRSQILFNELPYSDALASSPNFFDFGEVFEEHAGISLTKYLSICFGIIANWKSVSFYDKNQEKLMNFTMDRSTYFRNTPLSKEEYEYIVDILSNKRDELREAFALEGSGFPYRSLLRMKGKPLLEIAESKYVPFSLRYFEDYMTSGIFWLLESYVKDREKFTVFFGEVFERYIYEAIARMTNASEGKDIFYRINYKKGRNRRESIDIILVVEDTAVFIEVKSSRLRMIETVVEGNLEAFLEDISNTVIRAARQIENSYKDFKSGLLKLGQISPDVIKKVVPVYVSLEPLPLHEPTWRYIEKAIEDEGLLREDVFKRLHILNCEEVEIIEPLIKSGAALVNLLEQHRSSVYRNRSMKNFLHFDTSYKEAGGNQFLLERFKEIMNVVSEELFPGKASPS